MQVIVFALFQATSRLAHADVAASGQAVCRAPCSALCMLQSVCSSCVSTKILTTTTPHPLSCRYFHKGSLAYVGGDQAVMDIPTVGPIFGREAGVMWKGYETFAQVGENASCQRLLPATSVASLVVLVQGAVRHLQTDYTGSEPELGLSCCLCVHMLQLTFTLSCCGGIQHARGR
jgi:hypothetical protein